jgi:probable HAF family extracellular repeat protein
MIDLGTGGARSSRATQINEAGQVVGILNFRRGDDHAFIWEAGIMVDLGSLGEHLAEVVAINNAGQVAAQSMTPMGTRMATRWEKAPH